MEFPVDIIFLRVDCKTCLDLPLSWLFWGAFSDKQEGMKENMPGWAYIVAVYLVCVCFLKIHLNGTIVWGNIRISVILLERCHATLRAADASHSFLREAGGEFSRDRLKLFSLCGCNHIPSEVFCSLEVQLYLFTWLLVWITYLLGGNCFLAGFDYVFWLGWCVACVLVCALCIAFRIP